MGEIGSNASVKQNNIAAIRDALYRVDFATKKEIAARCGFSEYSIFYRTFKRRLGWSPEALRDNGFRPDI